MSASDPARRPATIKTITKALSLSASTVSRALQGAPSVTEKTPPTSPPRQAPHRWQLEQGRVFDAQSGERI